jgi:hypothetical protein
MIKININMNTIKSICTLICFILCTSVLLAKDFRMNDDGKFDPKDMMESTGAASFEEQLGTETGAMGDVPLDGGISLLLAAGMAYGGRRMAARRN